MGSYLIVQSWCIKFLKYSKAQALVQQKDSETENKKNKQAKKTVIKKYSHGKKNPDLNGIWTQYT